MPIKLMDAQVCLSNLGWNDYSIIKCTGEAVIAAHPVIVILYLA
jgi:hypothetical protein